MAALERKVSFDFVSLRRFEKVWTLSGALWGSGSSPGGVKLVSNLPWGFGLSALESVGSMWSLQIADCGVARRSVVCTD